MGFGLNIIEPKLEVDKTDWVNYNGILMAKNTARAKKAWETMRKQKKKKSYNRKEKNEVREVILDIIQKLTVYSRILTMETPDFLLAKPLNDYRFYIGENNIETYKNMRKNKPSNVILLHHGEIYELSNIEDTFECIYLDFCCTFEKAEKSIQILLNKIAKSNYFGFTFCLRKNHKKLEDYQFDMIRKIQELLDKFPFDCFPYRGEPKITSKLIYAKAYRDKYHAPMVTLFFKNVSYGIQNMDKDVENDYTRLTEELRKKCILTGLNPEGINSAKLLKYMLDNKLKNFEALEKKIEREEKKRQLKNLKKG